MVKYRRPPGAWLLPPISTVVSVAYRLAGLKVVFERGAVIRGSRLHSVGSLGGAGRGQRASLCSPDFRRSHPPLPPAPASPANRIMPRCVRTLRSRLKWRAEEEGEKKAESGDAERGEGWSTRASSPPPHYSIPLTLSPSLSVWTGLRSKCQNTTRASSRPGLQPTTSCPLKDGFEMAWVRSLINSDDTVLGHFAVRL